MFFSSGGSVGTKNQAHMKKYTLNINTAFLTLLTGLLLFTACEKEEDNFVETRLFQPVLNEGLYSIDNTIIVDMGKMKRAQSYTIELSRDTFKTEPLLTMEADTNFVVITDLLWNTVYQVRAQAHAEAPEFDSKVAMLGNVKTKRYPSILNLPTEFDVTDTRARLSWIKAGAEVTHATVYAGSDERLENPLEEVDITGEEAEEGVKIVAGLEPETKYQIALYSGETLRGWVEYTTKVALPSGPNVIDLSGLPGTALADTLPDIAGESVVILERGVTYETGGYDFDKSLTIQSGYGFTPAFATILCNSNFNLANGANVGYVRFKEIHFTGNFSSDYVFNIDQSGSIGDLKFEDCRIRLLRGVVRAKGGQGTISNYSIINSMVDSVNGYAVMTMDVNASATDPGWRVGDLLLKNSTFAYIQYFLVSRTNTNSIVIEDCTIIGAPEAGRQLFRWRGGAGNNNVTNGITIRNTIIGPGWDMSASGNVAVKGFDGLGETNFTVVNSYLTSDFVFASEEIPGFTVYGKTAEELWVNPANLNFNIKDSGFTAKNSAGDPRWRPGL